MEHEQMIDLLDNSGFEMIESGLVGKQIKDYYATFEMNGPDEDWSKVNFDLYENDELITQLFGMTNLNLKQVEVLLHLIG